MRGHGGPISPAVVAAAAASMIPSSVDHISPLTTDIMASIAARANQVVHQQNAYGGGIAMPQKQRQIDHLVDKDLQYMQNMLMPDRMLHQPQAQMAAVLGGGGGGGGVVSGGLQLALSGGGKILFYKYNFLFT